jgi:CheY-like chemotaxis protein
MTSGPEGGDAPLVDKGPPSSRPTGEREGAAKSEGHSAVRATGTGKPAAQVLSWDEPPEIVMTPDAGEPANRSKIVVAVDDDAENVAIIGKIARFIGYTFFGVSSGEDCVSLSMRVAPRLILLDVQMPGIDGYETCRLLRNNPNLAQIPIAFLTARKTAEDVKRSMAVGGNDFIIKPFDATQLSERIQYWVNRRVSVRAKRR